MRPEKGSRNSGLEEWEPTPVRTTEHDALSAYTRTATKDRGLTADGKTNEIVTRHDVSRKPSEDLCTSLPTQDVVPGPT